MDKQKVIEGNRDRKKHSKHHHKREDKESKDSGRRHRNKRRREENTASSPNITLPNNAKPLTEADYFLASKQFRTWLASHKKKRFEDLSSEEAHERFKSFVTKYNAGNLEDYFYGDPSCMPEDLVKVATKTKHKWRFNLTDSERRKLTSTVNSIHSTTESTQPFKVAAAPSPATASSRPMVRPRADPPIHPEISKGGIMTQHYKATYKSALDDIAPKETGRAGMIDRRKTIGNSLHGASRARDVGMDGCDLPEDVIMGSSSNDFQRLLSRQRNWKEKENMRKNALLEAARAKDEEANRLLLGQLGLKAGDKVTMKPR